MREEAKRSRVVRLVCALLAVGGLWLAWFPLEGSAQRNEGGPGMRNALKSGVPATPGAAGHANVALPKFPKKFDVQGPESDSFVFAVTQPGPIAVEVQAQGAQVVVTLQSFSGGQPITQRGPGLLRLFYNVTPQDVQRTIFWQVQVRAWCEEDCLTPGKRPRATGVVRVQHPPVDQAAVQKAVQTLVAQQKQASPQELHQAGAQAAAQMEQAFQQRKAQFEQYQQQRRAALYAQIRPQVDQLRNRLGMGAQIRPRGLEEAEDVQAEGVPQEEQAEGEQEVGTRALPEMRRPMRPEGQTLSVEPNRSGQAPTFPQKFQVQGPESASFAFGVTQPGPIEVQVNSQGPPVIVTLQHLASPPITQQGVGQVRLSHPVTAEEIQKSALWVVKVRLVQPGPPVNGTIMVQHPPTDQAMVQAQAAAMVQQEAAQQSRSEPEAEARSRAEFHEFKSRLDQQYQQRLTAERAQNQTLLNRLRAKPGNMIRSRGLNPTITRINKSEGQPKTQVIIEGASFGSGGEVVFQLGPNITGTGIVEAWADTVVVANVPDASGLLPYQGTVAIKVGPSLSNTIPFKFIPVEEAREIRSAQGQDVSLADPSILTGSKIEHPNQSFGGFSGAQGNDIFFPSRQLSNGWVVQDIKLKVDPCSYPDCRGAYVTDSRIRTPYPFFNVRWGHGPFVGARYWFTLWIVGPRGVPDGIVVTGPLNPYVPPGTPPPATTASNTPEERTPPSQPPYTPPASSQPIEMTVVQVNPALIPGYQVGPGAGTGTTQSPPPAGQSGGKVAVDPNNLKLEQVPPGAQSSTPPSGGTSTGTGMSTPPSQPPGPTTPMITSLSVTQGQPGDPVMITGSNFGPGLGEIHFVIANGRDVKAPAGAIWSDGQIFTSVPDGPDATGLLAFNGTVYIKRAGDGKVSNLAGFRFEPALRHRDIGCSPVTQDRRIQGEHQYTFLVPCVEQNGAGDLFGAKGNDEFYLSTKLSNGWVVNSVDVRQTYRYGTSGAYNWADRAGTDSPYVNIRWWRNTFSSVAYTFTVTIIGPRGVPDGIVCKQAPCSDY
jgi:hypothetical protein